MNMQNFLWPLLLAALCGCQPGGGADLTKAEGYILAQQHNCFACHSINEKSFCPEWLEVADKYRGDAGAEARLAGKIADGGSGVWGDIVMPPHPQISEADRKTMAKFVLSLK
jgi:cytochrome c